MIDEKKLIEDIGNMVKPLTTPDGCGIYDSEIRAYNEGLIDAMETANEQPKVGDWIPVKLREIKYGDGLDKIELNIFEFVRKDEDVDNVDWLADMMDAYKKLVKGFKESEE